MMETAFGGLVSWHRPCWVNGWGESKVWWTEFSRVNDEGMSNTAVPVLCSMVSGQVFTQRRGCL